MEGTARGRLRDAVGRAVLALAAAGLVLRLVLVPLRRPMGAVLVLLAGYATGVNLATHYVVWVIPFLILCGWTLVSVALWLASVAGAVLIARRIAGVAPPA